MKPKTFKFLLSYLTICLIVIGVGLEVDKKKAEIKPSFTIKYDKFDTDENAYAYNCESYKIETVHIGIIDNLNHDEPESIYNYTNYYILDFPNQNMFDEHKPGVLYIWIDESDKGFVALYESAKSKKFFWSCLFENELEDYSESSYTVKPIAVNKKIDKNRTTIMNITNNNHDYSICITVDEQQ